ncbi:MAG: hypothetical protein HRT74_01530 [Flavobacteriales bacterium]|nr:hypothetical protein [Flavobacteriales bacterium]
MQRFLLSCVFIAFALTSFGQSKDDIDILYSHQFTGGLNLHTNGGGINAQFLKYKDAFNLRYVGLEIVFMKHDKEIRSFNPVYEDSKAYVVGKANSFYIARPTFGKQRVLTTKQRKSGVEVGYQWGIGPSLGFTKPIYLEIGYPSIPYDYLVVERYNPDEHFTNNIFGRASGLRGFDQLKFHPGGFAKFALNFEYSSERNGIKAIQVGSIVDVYAEEIPIMADLSENSQFFLNGFVNNLIVKKYILR